jgi:hypothetical protein
MRNKSLSPFVRTVRSSERPADSRPQSLRRVSFLLLLTAVMVLSPIAFTASESTIVEPMAAQADAGSGRRSSDSQAGKGRPSMPPGKAKKSAEPRPTPAATATPTPVAATPAATSTPAPTAVPTPNPTPTSGKCSSGPGSAPSGWRRVMSDSFNENISLGEWGRPGGHWEFPGGMWRARPAGYRDSSGRGTYDSPKTTSQHDGLLDVWIHSEGSTRYVSAPLPLVADTVGQRISICMRADEIPGYKMAFLLWPNEGPGNYHGEINFPEAKLLSTATAHAFMHFDPEPVGGKTQDAYDSGALLQQWHVYTTEWHPHRNYVSFYVDGRLIGHSERPEVPDGPMHYVMQMETYMAGEPLPAPAEGHVLVDWFMIDLPA